ncbi:MAG: hypothetical protein QF408_07030 [Pirellulales bacterium]|jgi:hypothetical protein|nr:hypothetical protein [Pirellulales bacterium]HJN65267.1 hypothetical protein [Pirellulales bacterium]|tara:strand:- start:439 stop:702 length:264 start_codon:yes stop_codon:yes gene_type:complete
MEFVTGSVLQINGLNGLGGLAILVGVIWTAVIAFQKENIIWGILCLLCAPLVALIYGVLNFDRAMVPVILIIVGIILGGVGYGNLLF